MKYLDVLYTPLDIPCRPSIDIQKFNEWAWRVYPQDCIRIEGDSKFVAHDRLKNDVYPWNLAYGMHAGQWKNDFDILFPDLAKYCYEGFGIPRDYLYTVLFLPTRPHFIGKTFWHADPDPTGLRFYLKNDDYFQNLLLVRETKWDVHDIWKLNAEDLEEFLERDTSICNVLTSDQSFFLNNLYAAHSPYNNTSSDRIAVFVTIKAAYANKVLEEVVAPLIVRSANKYCEYAILRKQ
jgi:hypothetical protein